MKHLILMRHARTEKIEFSSRQITKAGIKELYLRINQLIKYSIGSVIILHSNTIRATQTAIHISKNIQSTLCMFESRILGAYTIRNRVEEYKKKNMNVAAMYSNREFDYSEKLERKQELYKRWMSVIKEINATTVIIVGHEGALEGFLSENNDFTVLTKSFDRYFDYSDYAVLRLNQDDT